MSASANLISNGSFEAPVGANHPGINNGYPTGWSGFGSMQVINGQPTASYPKAFDGDQYVTTANGYLTQGFTVSDADDFILRWYENTLTTGWNGSYGVRLRDASSATVTFQAFSYSTTGASPWRQREIDLALTPGQYTLEFEPGTSFTFLDLVTLDAVPSNAVPDSGGPLGLLGMALGGLHWLVRRPRAA
ncbi:MAG: hypothetical protein IT581_07765 [Verrucomicrobiales bacterium]|nr:hypothetical protein [Verrucomicrobiales bacterium]